MEVRNSQGVGQRGKGNIICKPCREAGKLSVTPPLVFGIVVTETSFGWRRKAHNIIALAENKTLWSTFNS